MRLDGHPRAAGPRPGKSSLLSNEELRTDCTAVGGAYLAPGEATGLFKSHVAGWGSRGPPRLWPRPMSSSSASSRVSAWFVASAAIKFYNMSQV